MDLAIGRFFSGDKNERTCDQTKCVLWSSMCEHILDRQLTHSYKTFLARRVASNVRIEWSRSFDWLTRQQRQRTNAACLANSKAKIKKWEIEHWVVTLRIQKRCQTPNEKRFFLSTNIFCIFRLKNVFTISSPLQWASELCRLSSLRFGREWFTFRETHTCVFRSTP